MTKIIAFWLAIPAVLLAQSGASSQNRPPFDVASIKPHPPAPGPFRSSSTVDPDGIRYSNVTLKSSISQAYSAANYQVIGGPDWIASERYDILAKAAAASPKAQLMLMLQSLLENRFLLRVLRETRELSIYSLIVAKNAPKIRPAKDDGAAGEDYQLAADDSGNQLTARRISLATLASLMSRQFQRRVVDATKLNGVYELTLNFAPADASTTDDGSQASIFTAVQEQLGLKLEPGKGPVEVLVIDHAEKPAVN